MSFDDLTQNFNDNQRLAVFAWMVAEDLDRVVAVRRELFDGGGYLDFVDRLPAAWSQVSSRWNELINLINTAPLPELNNIGLTGQPLLIKLEAWNSARDRLLDEFEVGGPEINLPPPAPPPLPPHGLRSLRPRRPLRRKRALKWLASTLAHADNILESLTQVVQLSEIFKEIKHAIELVARDTSESLADGS